uniref:Uncharacterized protein n=1 Tax=Romanomermis culicivorax TaxID=13658 RepID=A0A915HP19_ROMCU
MKCGCMGMVVTSPGSILASGVIANDANFSLDELQLLAEPVFQHDIKGQLEVASQTTIRLSKRPLNRKILPSPGFRRYALTNTVSPYFLNSSKRRRSHKNLRVMVDIFKHDALTIKASRRETAAKEKTR